VIGYWGGSVLDAAKAIAALMTNSGDIMDYLDVIGEGRKISNTAAPMIALPTTAGTGTEVTKNAVITSLHHHVKVSMRSPKMIPMVAIIDPELTYSLPPAVTATTGMDALTQVLEAYVSNRATPLTDIIAKEGIKRGARSLYLAFKDGLNKEAREDMAMTSLFGGFALVNSGLGEHGFAEQNRWYVQCPAWCDLSQFAALCDEIQCTSTGTKKRWWRNQESLSGNILIVDGQS